MPKRFKQDQFEGEFASLNDLEDGAWGLYMFQKDQNDASAMPIAHLVFRVYGRVIVIERDHDRTEGGYLTVLPQICGEYDGFGPRENLGRFLAAKYALDRGTREEWNAAKEQLAVMMKREEDPSNPTVFRLQLLNEFIARKEYVGCSFSKPVVSLEDLESSPVVAVQTPGVLIKDFFENI